jgi:uncharacterized membrane protein YfcA
VHLLLLVALVAIGLGAGAQAVTGIGFALVCAPFLVLALGGDDGVRLSNLFGIAVNVLMLGAGDWKSINWRVLPALAVPGILAVPLAAWLISGDSPQTLSLITAILVLAAVVALIFGLRIDRLRGAAGAAMASVLSGSMTAISGVAGPPIAVYAANLDWTPNVQRGTLAAYFLCVNAAAVLSRGVPGMPTAIFLEGVSMVVLGFAGGVVAARLLDQRTVRGVTLALAAAGALASIAVALR